MSTDAAPLQFAPALPPEEAARADFYALLARLFYHAPDAEMLAALAGAEEIVAEESSGEGAGFALAWRDLTLAAAAADPAAVDEEYQALFVGAGKAQVTLVHQRLSGHERGRCAAGRNCATTSCGAGLRAGRRSTSRKITSPRYASSCATLLQSSMRRWTISSPSSTDFCGRRRVRCAMR